LTSWVFQFLLRDQKLLSSCKNCPSARRLSAKNTGCSDFIYLSKQAITLNRIPQWSCFIVIYSMFYSCKFFCFALLFSWVLFYMHYFPSVILYMSSLFLLLESCSLIRPLIKKETKRIYHWIHARSCLLPA
jgi:hypothetical protein